MATTVIPAARPTFLAVAIREAALAAAMAFLLAVPLLGFALVDIPGGITVAPRFNWVVIATVAVFIGRFLIALWRQLRPESFGQVFRAPKITAIGPFAVNDVIGWLLAAFAVSLPFLPFADRYIIDIAISVLIYVMLGWGLNIVVGLAGLLDLGYVAFYAVGAYSFALLSIYFDFSFWQALPLAGVFAAAFGVLLGFPVLRLRGDYLAIVTLGFGEIIRLVLLNWHSFTGGPNGISQIPRPSFFGFPFTRTPPEGVTAFHQLFGVDFDFMHRTYFLYYVILGLALITNLFSMRVRRLPLGRAWEALREDEVACRSLGINPTNTKLSAFALGAMFGGFAGSFFATRQGFISPESFTFIESAIILAIVVLGGMGSQLGIVVAAAFLILVPEFGRDFAQFRMLVFGAAMVLVMIWRPQGLVAHREPSIRLKPVDRRAA
ncbi:MAG TPA: high-affinity branched-chain amino acid ABC transporter permease LivM [Alphaproteobacteria bacterium]